MTDDNISDTNTELKNNKFATYVADTNHLVTLSYCVEPLAGEVHYSILGIDVYERDIDTKPPTLEHVASYSVSNGHQVLTTGNVEGTVDALVNHLEQDNAGKEGFDQYFDSQKATDALTKMLIKY
jgi:hypothetical protein